LNSQIKLKANIMEIEKETLNKETFLQEYKGVLIAGVALLVLGIILLFNFVFSTKRIAVSPGAMSFQAGENYEIKWSAANVGRVGIVLFGGDQPQWIAHNYPAGAGRYVWQSDPYQEAGAEYRFAVFEYPWKKGNAIAYSPALISIIGQKYVSCDSYSVEQNWPYLPSKHPGVLRAFITQSAFDGNLGGIDGADQKCAQEAQKMGYDGTYIAFLGTDDKSARERAAKDGIFVEAGAIGQSVEGRFCHRYLAQNLQKLMDKINLSKEAAQIQFSGSFNQGFGNLWLGRMSPAIEKKCLSLGIDKEKEMMFSNSYTCQNWTANKRLITGAADANLTRCYDLEGKNLVAKYYGAATITLSEQGGYGLGAASCDAKRRLLCVEQ